MGGQACRLPGSIVLHDAVIPLTDHWVRMKTVCIPDSSMINSNPCLTWGGCAFRRAYILVSWMTRTCRGHSGDTPENILHGSSRSKFVFCAGSSVAPERTRPSRECSPSHFPTGELTDSRKNEILSGGDATVSLTRRMDPGHILHGSSREEGSEKVFLKKALCTSEGYQVHRQPLKDSLEDKVIVLLEDILGDDTGPVCMGQDATAFADQGERWVMPSKNIKLIYARGIEYPGKLAEPRIPNSTHARQTHTDTHILIHMHCCLGCVRFPQRVTTRKLLLSGGLPKKNTATEKSAISTG
jgi:hypothetical protein